LPPQGGSGGGGGIAHCEQTARTLASNSKPDVLAATVFFTSTVRVFRNEPKRLNVGQPTPEGMDLSAGKHHVEKLVPGEQEAIGTPFSLTMAVSSAAKLPEIVMLEYK
jgi:hypothetical protein